jgi:hypothetical protein
MKKRLRSHSIFVLLAFLLGSCQLFDKDEQKPSYITVDSVSIAPDYANFGTNSHQISDVWVYANDVTIGCFELPAKIPILATGNTKLSFEAGIKVNGISATRTTYPFYSDTICYANLSPDYNLHFKPVFKFYPTAIISFNEDFESAGIIFESADTSSKYAPINATNQLSNVFVNTQNYTEVSNWSGVINLDTAKNITKIRTVSAYSLPKNGTFTFLEFNYKCSTYLTVGLAAYTSSTITNNDIVVYKPTCTWKKAYVNLTTTVSGATNALNYRVYFYGGLRSGATSDIILLDNIKLIHAPSSKSKK